MKYLANFFRVFVGLLFIFSGLIKSNDPTGFSYKLDEYFSVFSEELEPEQDSIYASITTLDGTLTVKAPTFATTLSYPLTISTTTWMEVPLDDLQDAVYFSDATISIAGLEMFTTSLNAQDSNKVLLEAQIAYGIGDKQLGKEKIAFTSFDVISKTINVDVSSHILANSWLVNFFQLMRQYALALAIFLCVLEIVLGVALLIGWSPRLIIALLILLIVFFTFLTWYSAYFNKVTDCGCFGDAIKLTPWESFYKDIILCISIFFITAGITHIKPIFSKPFAVKLLTISVVFSVSFAVYCWHYLPVKNFLKFKKGNNIKELVVLPDGAPSDVYENIFIYSKDGVHKEFSLAEMSGRDLKDEGYEFVDRRDKLISKGYEPEIHDFKIMDETRDNNYVDNFFANDTAYKIVIVINEVDKVNTKTIGELKDIIKACKKEGIDIYPLTASNSQKVDAFSQEYQLNIPFYYGDKTNLKSIIRSNPGLVLFNGNVVQKNWPSTRLPSVKHFLKKIAE
jgi:uncharacterized membrane protein YphA (DoxX/SURF4 family)